MPYFVYILRTSKNTLYTGQTNDLSNRLKVHREKSSRSSKYLRAFGSFKLVYSEKLKTRSDALKREAEIKNLTKLEKEELIGRSKILRVYVGRFAPLHIGHQALIDKMLSKYGIQNCLILIGSSNSYTERTPYTYKEREKMVKTVYPKIKVSPLPDMKPNLPQFDGTTDDLWLMRIKKLEMKMKRKFVFYGGSKKDLEVLSKKFETHILIQRKNGGLGFSATKAREALKNGNYKTLKKMIDPTILKFVITGYNTFCERKS